MKRRDLLRLAGASAAGLLLPSWLFPQPTKRLVVPGFRLESAELGRRTADIYGRERWNIEAQGHRLVVRRWHQRDWKDTPLLKQVAEGNLPPDAGFTEGPALVLDEPERPATTEETRDFLNQWVRFREIREGYPKERVQLVSIEEAQAVVEDCTLDDYLFNVYGSIKARPSSEPVIVSVRSGNA